VERRKGAMQAIYSSALKRNPALAGKMALELTVEPSGQVSQVAMLGHGLV